MHPRSYPEEEFAMAAPRTVPVDISPDAANRIQELGLQKELQAMLDHTQEAVPSLQLIDVRAWEDFDEPGPLHIALTGWRDGASKAREDFRQQEEWGAWLVRTFPPGVARWFSFDLLFRGEHGR
jgi:hypothetical protein